MKGLVRVVRAAQHCLLSCARRTITGAVVHPTQVAAAATGPGSRAVVKAPRPTGSRTRISSGEDIESATVTGGTVSGFRRPLTRLALDAPC